MKFILLYKGLGGVNGIVYAEEFCGDWDDADKTALAEVQANYEFTGYSIRLPGDLTKDELEGAREYVYTI